MLAAKADLDKLKCPLYVSPKLDGVRGIVIDGVFHTRSLKPIANLYTQNRYSDKLFSRLDGELIVGNPNHRDAYRTTNSAVSSIHGSPDATFHVFDYVSQNVAFTERLGFLKSLTLPSWVRLVPQILCVDMKQVFELEERFIDQGYEGAMLRTPESLYKYGRSTVNEGYLLKLKRFEDSDAEVLEVIEKLHNNNTATTNELGYTERSSHQENMIPMGTMGALRVRDLHSDVEFNIGTGFTDQDRAWWWSVVGVGRTVKYKFQPAGVKDKPRFPVYLGLRDCP